MKINFRVHAVNQVPVTRSVELSPGVKVAAAIQALHVQLCGEDGSGVGALTLEFVEPAAIEEARKTFLVDELVSFSV